ncbi:hypothetical protein DFH07DRAFT_963661 [Mycena maculata]|uniref:Ribonuclease H1 N-terminal domain-containing protein n=1 Tax=Mycena maculata TaxID=230809 RepID=A0AAD7IJB5_9AGAR|nr:hypothetical protein DFH07DRAFT_963661 [Mycena maculata]
MTQNLPPGDDDFDDREICALISNLELLDVEDPRPPPRTPSPRRSPSPPAYRTPFLTPQSSPGFRTRAGTSTFPALGTRTNTTSYIYDSPTGRQRSDDWSTAGTATQGVPHTRVYAVIGDSARKKKKPKGPKKAAYVVFCGRQFGVFQTWPETVALVSGVPNCIFRGYSSVLEADTAFAYALERGWVRCADATPVAAIPKLPRPESDLPDTNPISAVEAFDGKWYIVYRGILPGIYRSHLECQLNTLGVRNALHESVWGWNTAVSKYTAAVRCGETSVVMPPFPQDFDEDVFQ